MMFDSDAIRRRSTNTNRKLRATCESLSMSVLRLRGNAAPQTLLSESHGKVRGVALQLHARRLAGGHDLLFRVRLNLGQLGCGMACQALAFRLCFLLRLGAKGGDLAFHAGQ